MEFFKERDVYYDDKIKNLTDAYKRKDLNFHNDIWKSWTMTYKPDVYSIDFYNNLIKQNIEEQKILSLCELTNINLGFESGHGECKNHSKFMIFYNLIIEHNLKNYTKKVLLKYGISDDIVKTLKLNKFLERTPESRIDYLTFFLSMEAIILTNFYKNFDASEILDKLPKDDFTKPEPTKNILFKGYFSRLLINVMSDKFTFKLCPDTNVILPGIIIENDKQLMSVKHLLKSLNKDVVLGIRMIHDCEKLISKEDFINIISSRFKKHQYKIISHSLMYSHRLNEIIDSNDFFDLHKNKYSYPIVIRIDESTTHEFDRFIPKNLSELKFVKTKFLMSYDTIYLNNASMNDYKIYLMVCDTLTKLTASKFSESDYKIPDDIKKLSTLVKDKFYKSVINSKFDNKFDGTNIWYLPKVYKAFDEIIKEMF